MELTRRFRGFLPALSLFTLCFSTVAHAGQGCVTIFLEKYPDTQTYANGGCQACHQSATGGSAFNVYGIDLQDKGAAGEGFNCTGGNFLAALSAVEGMDSDGEGNSNLVEITAGTQPGWCEETPGSGCVNGPGVAPNVQLDPAPANNIPVADAGGPYSGEAGTTLIQFDGSGSSDLDNDPLSYAWDFGDGNSAQARMPTHTYASPGDFTVTLVVNDGYADSEPGISSAAISEPVINLAPLADPGGPYAGQPGVAVSFDGSGSSDPNGDVLSYSWDFGDGATGDGQSPSHVYAAEGIYTVTLEVSDGLLTSVIATTTAEITAPGEQSEGELLYAQNCLACHGDPWDGQAVDETLPGLRRVAGARSCNIHGSIFGTSVFPNGVPDMQFLQGLPESAIDALAEYLNSRESSGERRYVTACAGCHGNDGLGGRTGESVYGGSAGETWEAIGEEHAMRYLACMPRSDIEMIVDFLKGPDSGFDSAGISDEHEDSSGGGSPGLPFIFGLGLLAGSARYRQSRARRKS